ncbi:hypothetical protein EDB80DRAFT_720042 [Ilyonectria destructans]|nr:hypothetical protein EDB80DRAFT_720042 [Ilyonectria destructans]
MTAFFLHQRETSEPRGALSESSPSVANRDVSPVYAEGYDSAQHSLSPTIAASCSPSATPDLSQGIPQSSPSSSLASTRMSASQSVTSPGSQSRYTCELCQAPFDRIDPLAEHYRSCPNNATVGSYHCGTCPLSNRFIFKTKKDFIRHLRTDRHLPECFYCRCGKRFKRIDRFRSHFKQGECQGNSSYACMCGHAVQNYSDVSTHINKCYGPQPIGRPRKKPVATGDPEASS